MPSNVSIVSVRQPQPLGLGHAVLCAKSVIGNDDFAVLLPDVLVKDNSEKMIYPRWSLGMLRVKPHKLW